MAIERKHGVAIGDLAERLRPKSPDLSSALIQVGSAVNDLWNNLSNLIVQVESLSASDLANGTTGTGAIVLQGSPTIVTPTIASFTNAQHNHENAAGGGQLDEDALALTDVTTNNSTTGRHGFIKKLSNISTEYMNGQGNWATPPDTQQTPWAQNINAAGFNLSTLGQASFDTGKYITQESWTDATLQNSWVNFGGSSFNVGYMKDKQGRVWLRGLAKNGTATDATTIFTLPSGYRPSSEVTMIASCLGGGVYGTSVVDVTSAGVVAIYGAQGNTYLAFDGLSLSTV